MQIGCGRLEQLLGEEHDNASIAFQSLVTTGKLRPLVGKHERARDGDASTAVAQMLEGAGQNQRDAAFAVDSLRLTLNGGHTMQIGDAVAARARRNAVSG